MNVLAAWASRSLSPTSGRFALTLRDGRLMTVAFRHSETTIESEPVLGFPPHSETDFYHLTLRLLEL